MSKAVRQIVRFIKRIRNRISSYYNLMRLKMYGVQCGRHCVVHGKLYVHLFPSAKVKIGNSLYFSSGWGVNALCANRRGMIYATHDACITIGNNVGMSSTVLWAHKKLLLGIMSKLVEIVLLSILMHTIWILNCVEALLPIGEFQLQW